MTGLQEITAVILAGGLGTRLREVVADRPKILAEVNGRPFLAYLLDKLADSGICKVVLCTGYLAELVCRTFGDSYRGMSINYSKEEIPIGTGGALRLALPFIFSDPVLVMNGDSYCDADLRIFAQHHHTAKSPASLILVQVPDVVRYGAVDVDGANRVVSFREKGCNSGEGIINAGIYLLSRHVIEHIPSERVVSLERDIFPALIGKGLHAFPHDGRFIDIGVPSDYYAASSYLTRSN